MVPYDRVCDPSHFFNIFLILKINVLINTLISKNKNKKIIICFFNFSSNYILDPFLKLEYFTIFFSFVFTLNLYNFDFMKYYILHVNHNMILIIFFKCTYVKVSFTRRTRCWTKTNKLHLGQSKERGKYFLRLFLN